MKFDDLKKHVQNIDTKKIQDTIGENVNNVKKTLEENYNKVKDQQPGEAINTIRSSFSSLPREKKLIIGGCIAAVIALIIIIAAIFGGRSTLDQFNGSWQCGIFTVDIDTEKKLVTGYLIPEAANTLRFQVEKVEGEQVYFVLDGDKGLATLLDENRFIVSDGKTDFMCVRKPVKK